MEGQPLTFGLISIVVGAVVLTGGTVAGIVLWLTGKLSGLKDEVMAEIRKTRTEGDQHLEVVRDRIHAVGNRVQTIEVDIARNFLSRDEAKASFDRLEGKLDRLTELVAHPKPAG